MIPMIVIFGHWSISGRVYECVCLDDNTMITMLVWFGCWSWAFSQVTGLQSAAVYLGVTLYLVGSVIAMNSTLAFKAMYPDLRVMVCLYDSFRGVCSHGLGAASREACSLEFS